MLLGCCMKMSSFYKVSRPKSREKRDVLERMCLESLRQSQTNLAAVSVFSPRPRGEKNVKKAAAIPDHK